MNANRAQLVQQLNSEWNAMTDRVKATEERCNVFEKEYKEKSNGFEKRLQELKNDQTAESEKGLEKNLKEHKDEWDKKFADEGARLDQLVAALREDAKTSVGNLEEKATALENATAKMQTVTSEMQAEGNKYAAAQEHIISEMKATANDYSELQARVVAEIDRKADVTGATQYMT